MASQTGSTRFTPAAVANRIGQIAAAAIRKTMAPSQLGKASTATGIQASGEIIRSSWNGGWRMRSAKDEEPISSPSGAPSPKATRSPWPIRNRLGAAARHASPEVSSSAKEASAGPGAKPAKAA